MGIEQYSPLKGAAKELGIELRKDTMTEDTLTLQL